MSDEAQDPAEAERDAAKWSAVEEGLELLQEGDVDAALAELTRVVEVDAENEYAHFFLGNAYFEREDFPRALKCYVTALEVAPKYIGAMVAAGQTLRLLGDHARALRMGKQVLRLRKDDADALYLLGMVHFQRGEHPQARGFLERFLQTNPEIEVAMEVEGMLQIIRGEAQPLEEPEPEIEA
ncbi:MAG TPA: tetratricopeptide repeat protein [Polyangiaceae bacterium LLY-WYZ-15_(1-7)]|nr:tetratricopeptide repeat protein [Polyangiaceae bacterium LLY-WYZ-15_(1-7)]HJL02610.1 tetratricopeptide repeat protein [Polyangiaceae bacterium LLY-WYZ-15_(1-7)]HJL11280.1 tetratricopeptide repeat protein [Polyangiaceae bacterium LLY-WYZ-15_(1-7)]HJL32460.1 tetratricopeptide repeat protein [Polyangiaceae bacterium LLY-WYZ-15_(1-7)]HJL47111.1 tetratricopeptide repeat protein [Polyangiaceae bacterium LLY-WYZ-15_(1-7)]